MYYKVLSESTVLDVMDGIIYVRYQESNRSLVICSKDVANGILSSGANKVWHTGDLKEFPIDGYDTVTLEEIDEDEYTALKELLDADDATEGTPDTYIAPDVTLSFLKEKKIQQMSEECSNTIIRGFDIRLSDNKVYHFDMTLEDQLNISSLKEQLLTGATEVPYHASGELCRMYSAYDIGLVIEKGMNFKTYHVTYFNSLKNYINSIEYRDVVRDVTYGTAIPEEYKSDVLKLLEQA